MPKYLKPGRSGSSQIGICQRSGQKMLRADMVEDGQVQGELVHPDWWEPYHPLLLPPPMRPDGLPKQRPAPDDVFPMTAGVLTGLLSGGSGGGGGFTWIWPALLGGSGSGGEGVLLTWTQFTSTGSQLESYNVWRSIDGGVSFQLLGSVPVTQDIELIYRRVQGDWQQQFVYGQPFVDPEGEAGYQYYIQGVQIHGLSANSNIITIAAPAVQLYSAWTPWAASSGSATYAAGTAAIAAGKTGVKLVVIAEIVSGDQVTLTYGGTSPTLVLGPGDGTLGVDGPITQVFDLEANPPASDVLTSNVACYWSAFTVYNCSSFAKGPEGNVTHPSFTPAEGSMLMGCGRAFNPSTNIPNLTSSDGATISQNPNIANPYSAGVMSGAYQQPTAATVNWAWTEVGNGTNSVIFSP